jgi:hypothetical protein
MSDTTSDVWAEWRENQAPFKPFILKRYLTQWPLWQPVEHLVDQFFATELRTGSGTVVLGAGDEARVKSVLQKVCTPGDWNKINALVSMHKLKVLQDRVLAEVFMAQLAKAYETAYMKYDLDFISGSGADYRYRYQFLALKFRDLTKIPANTPYDKRLKGIKLEVTADGMLKVIKIKK